MNALIVTIGPMVVLFYGVKVLVWKPMGMDHIIDKITAHFRATITVGHGHMINKQIVQWLAENVVGANKKDLTLHGNGTVKASNSLYEDQDPDRIAPLEYVPAASEEVSFWFANHKIFIRRGEPTQVEIHDAHGRPISGRSKTQAPDIILSCFTLTGSAEPIMQLLNHIRMINERQVTQMTAYYRMNPSPYPDDPPWAAPVMRASRDMDSLVMEESKKADLLQDVATYLSAESKAYYKKHGIPNRRGYLFWGPPGTGKTSCAVALAGHFGLSVFIVSLPAPTLGDDVLERMFDQLPDKCLVLLEDVDSAGIQRENMTQDQPADPDNQKRVVTLSGLLNAIDGPCSQESRVLILTSNEPDSLDSALVRPGRCDVKILFGFAGVEVIEKLFVSIVSENPAISLTTTELTNMSKKFSQHIPEDKLTTAEIQGFLLQHRSNPAEALDLVAAWAKALVATEASGKNVDSSKGQVDSKDEETTESKDDEATDPEDEETTDSEDEEPTDSKGEEPTDSKVEESTDSKDEEPTDTAAGAGELVDLCRVFV